MHPRYRSLLVKLGFTIFLVAVLLWRTNVHSIVSSLSELTFNHWVGCLFIFLGVQVLAAWKWKILLPDRNFATLLQLNFIAQYYSLLLPGQIAGEAVKTYRLARGQRDAEKIAASVAIDRITSFIGLLFVALAGMMGSVSRVDHRVLTLLIIVVVLLLGGLFVFHLPVWPRLGQGREDSPDYWARFARSLNRLAEAWRSYLRRRVLLCGSILLGAVLQLASVWINSRLGNDLGIHLGLNDWCWIFGIVSIVVVLPFTFGGIGLREGSFAGALGLVGVSSDRAIALSLSIFSLLVVGALIGALLEWGTRQAPDNLAPSAAGSPVI